MGLSSTCAKFFEIIFLQTVGKIAKYETNGPWCPLVQILTINDDVYKSTPLPIMKMHLIKTNKRILR